MIKYIKISNDIWDALLKYNINGESRRILDFIIRKTYGFNKKTDIISLSQFTKATGINRRNVQRCVKKLINRKMVASKQTLGGEVSYCFNKDFDTWLGSVQTDAPASKWVKGSVKMGKKVASKQTHTKYNNKRQYTKDINTYCQADLKICSDVIDFLNITAKKHFKTTEKNKKLIRTRLREGWKFEDFKHVIEVKYAEWSNDPKMKIYIRPITLFGTKFESYRNQEKKKTFFELCEEYDKQQGKNKNETK